MAQEQGEVRENVEPLTLPLSCRRNKSPGIIRCIQSARSHTGVPVQAITGGAPAVERVGFLAHGHSANILSNCPVTSLWMATCRRRAVSLLSLGALRGFLFTDIENSSSSLIFSSWCYFSALPNAPLLTIAVMPQSPPARNGRPGGSGEELISLGVGGWHVPTPCCAPHRRARPGACG